MRTTRARRRWIVPFTAILLTFLVLSASVLYMKAMATVASGSSHILPINQWGYGSGTTLSKNYTHGVLTRTEHYAFQKHGYYELRYPIK